MKQQPWGVRAACWKGLRGARGWRVLLQRQKVLGITQVRESLGQWQLLQLLRPWFLSEGSKERCFTEPQQWQPSLLWAGRDISHAPGIAWGARTCELGDKGAGQQLYPAAHGPVWPGEAAAPSQPTQGPGTAFLCRGWLLSLGGERGFVLKLFSRGRKKSILCYFALTCLAGCDALID